MPLSPGSVRVRVYVSQEWIYIDILCPCTQKLERNHRATATPSSLSAAVYPATHSQFSTNNHSIHVATAHVLTQQPRPLEVNDLDLVCRWRACRKPVQVVELAPQW